MKMEGKHGRNLGGDTRVVRGCGDQRNPRVARAKSCLDAQPAKLSTKAWFCPLLADRCGVALVVEAGHLGSQAGLWPLESPKKQIQTGPRDRAVAAGPARWWLGEWREVAVAVAACGS